MAEPNFLPGQKAECNRCGEEVTLFRDGNWRHTKPASAQKHEIKYIDYDENNLITPEKSAEFVIRAEMLAKMRTIPGQTKAKKEKEAPPPPPEVEPHSPTDFGLRTTSTCKKCRKAIIVDQNDKGERVWVHKSGPQHVEPIVFVNSNLRPAKRSAKQKELIVADRKPIGKPKGDPKSGIVTIPGKPGKWRWDATIGDAVQVKEGREEEKIPSDPDYISATGEITSKQEAALSKETEVERGVRLTGEKHLEEDHPWIAETSLDPDKQNIDSMFDVATGKINKSKLADLPKGDILETTGVEENAGITQIPAREASWKSKTGRVIMDRQVMKRFKAWVDAARWHKSEYDKAGRYEYEVYVDKPASSVKEPRIGIRRRLKYCDKCAPVVLQDGSIPHELTDPTLPRMANPNQRFVRPEVQELPQGTKPKVEVTKAGNFTVRPLHTNSSGYKLVSAIKSARTKSEHFEQGRGEATGAP